MAKILGIDLGTSTSAVAVVENGSAKILATDERERIMPSAISFDPQGGRVRVGAVAKNQATTNPDFTFTALKRLLGRRFSDPQVRELAEHVSYEIVAGPNGEALLKGPDRAYSPEELLAHVVRHLKTTAQTKLGQQVTHAVVGVPANFDVLQKEAVRQVVRYAGLEVLGLLAEPTAAAIAYGVDRGVGKTIAVYDLGGGTFDVSLLKQGGQRFRVLATAGDTYLGGEDFDARLVDALAERFRAKHGLDLRAEPLTLQRLRLAAEQTKIELSGAEDFRVLDRFIAKDDDSGAIIDLDETLTRADLEELTADLVERTRAPCIDALRAARREHVDEVVMVGGMTNMPAVLELARNVFGRTPRRDINPVEAVALGCAIHGAARIGEIRSVRLDEVTNASFGVEAGGGAFVPIIRRGSAIPNAKTVRTGPIEPNATRVAVRVYQGDLKAAKDNRHICTLVLDGLEPGAPGQTDVDIRMDLDEDGVLSVRVTDPATKRAEHKRIHADTGLDGEALARLRAIGEDDEQGPENTRPDDQADENPPANGDSSPDAPQVVGVAPDLDGRAGLDDLGADDDDGWGDFNDDELAQVGAAAR